jgi:hypothetical protein
VPPQEVVAELPPVYIQTDVPETYRVILAACAHCPISIRVATEKPDGQSLADGLLV